EPLLRRVPRLHEVVVQAGLVDRLDGRLGVRVGGEQHAARLGEQLPRAADELEPAHLRHALVDQEEGDVVATQLGLLRELQSALAGVGPQHAVRLAVVTAQVPGHGGENGRVVIDRYDQRLPGSRPGGGGAFVWHGPRLRLAPPVRYRVHRGTTGPRPAAWPSTAPPRTAPRPLAAACRGPRRRLPAPSAP